MFFFSVCGEALVESAMKAEREFLQELDKLEIQVIEKLRDALAHSAIELRIKVDNATKNIDDAKDNVSSPPSWHTTLFQCPPNVHNVRIMFNER